jgi:hypothetical protein
MSERADEQPLVVIHIGSELYAFPPATIAEHQLTDEQRQTFLKSVHKWLPLTEIELDDESDDETEVTQADRSIYEGRKLPPVPKDSDYYVEGTDKIFKICGSGQSCNSKPQDTFSKPTAGKPSEAQKHCSATAGECAKHGCGCHLFRYEKNKDTAKEKAPWEHWADPGVTVTSDNIDYVYDCICVEVVTVQPA